MASPKMQALNREVRKLRSSGLQLEMSSRSGNRASRRQAARDLVKRLKQGSILARNEQNEIVEVEKKRRSISFHEALGKVSQYE